jgi:hypothetical protein
MMKTIFVRVALWVLLSFVLFNAWWYVASNNDYGALSGTYIFHTNGEMCVLHLRPDRTFVQGLSRAGKVQHSQGHWHRYGQSHVSFSNEFLALSGEEMNAAGEAHGEFGKTLGLFPYLVLAPPSSGPRFNKKLFR